MYVQRTKVFNSAILNVLEDNFTQLYIQDKTKYTLDHNTWGFWQRVCFKMYICLLVVNFDTYSDLTKCFIHDSLWMKISASLFIRLDCLYTKLFVILGVSIFHYDIISCGVHNSPWGCCVGQVCQTSRQDSQPRYVKFLLALLQAVKSNIKNMIFIQSEKFKVCSVLYSHNQNSPYCKILFIWSSPKWLKKQN